MYDADLRSSNIVFQYSYSHDNSHGLFWNCTVQSDSGIICRYNVSQNDKGIIFCVNYPVTSAYIYNNTVYCGPGLSPKIISERNVNSGTRSYQFFNNVIYNLSPGSTYDFRTSGYARTIDYNLYFGFHPPNEPSDPNKLTSDPKFISPGSGGTGVTTLDGYWLQPGSPCVDSGFLLPGHSNLDFWGNTVPFGGKVDRGAFEYHQGTSGFYEEHGNHARQFELAQNYPNPFNPETTILFRLASSQYLDLSVFDVTGKNVCTLKRGTGLLGSHRAVWDGTDDGGKSVPSGVYFARLLSGTGTSLIKMLLLR